MKANRLTVIMAMCVFAGSVFASDLTLVGSAKAGEEAVLKVDKNISRVIIGCTDGAVVIKQISVIAGDNENTFNQQASLKKGGRQQFTVGNAVRCDQLKITTEGQGSYEVHVRP